MIILWCMVALFFFSLRLSKASRRQKWRLHDSLTLQIYQLKAFLAQSLYAARIYPKFYIQLLYKTTLKFECQPNFGQKMFENSSIQKTKKQRYYNFSIWMLRYLNEIICPRKVENNTHSKVAKKYSN